MAAGKQLEGVLNKYDKTVNGLADKGKFDIKDSNGKVIGSMTGKEIKAVWNGTSFTVTSKSFNNGGAGGGTGGAWSGGSFSGRSELTPGAVSAYANAATARNKAPLVGLSTLPFHELGHETHFGEALTRKYPVTPTISWPRERGASSAGSHVRSCRRSIRLLHPGWLRMMRGKQIFIVLVALFSAAAAQSAPSDRPGLHATFMASNGGAIELNTQTGVLRSPRSRGAKLHDCSDESQVCLTDRHGFAFAYFRRCNDADPAEYKRLRFPPKVASALDNSDVWMVFDAAPNYLFHYAYSRGIVGIYVGATPAFDFRSVLRDRKFNLASLDAMEYRITGRETVAACSE